MSFARLLVLTLIALMIAVVDAAQAPPVPGTVRTMRVDYFHTGDAKQEPPDRIRRPRTVVEHVVPGRITLDENILTERAEPVIE